MHLTHEQIKSLIAQHGTPLYVYSRSQLADRARTLMGLAFPFGVTVRYAVKANPHPEVIQVFARNGLHFDASSSYEAEHLLEQGIAGHLISLSSQQPAHNLPQLLEAGVQFVATSMHQLEAFASAATSGATVGLRVNPGIGSGHQKRTTTGGAGASFGLWHEYLDDALALAHQHGVTMTKLHTHIGSGADPSAWANAMDTALQLAARMPDVTVLDIGGGYKVKRVEGEPETDMSKIAGVFSEKLQEFAGKTGRKLKLEMEPGTWLVAHAGVLLTDVVDIVDTGRDGFVFLRTNTGMNDFMRPTLYGAQHTMEVINDSNGSAEYVVVGHNCESSDILTPAPGEPEQILPRRLRKASIGDIIAIYDTGAYCASLRAHGYNAFPSAPEVVVD